MENKDLAMMGEASVRKTQWHGREAIHKSPVTPTEIYFYQKVAPHLEASRISAPELLAASAEEGIWIEFIPHAVNQSETSEPVFMRALSGLHEAELILETDKLFRYQWNSRDTEHAIARFEPEQRRLIERFLPTFFDRRAEIFEPLCPVSGDTNVFNWGRRMNGDLVLFDWERFGVGSPAIDLAPMIPGLPGIKTVDHYCAAYLKVRKHGHFSHDDLRQQVLTTKAWLVLEVVNILHERNNPEIERYMEWLNRCYGRWLVELGE